MSALVAFSYLSQNAIPITGALYMAGHYCIPEVCLYFNCKLMRGNRTSKVSTNRLDAFDTPNFPPLATLEVDVQVTEGMMRRTTNMNAKKRSADFNFSRVWIIRFPHETNAQ